MPYDTDQLAHAVALLERDGFFTDEDAFGSYAVEHDTDELVEALRGAGYCGERLESGGATPMGAAVYWLFNPDAIDPCEAREAAVKRHLERMTDYLQTLDP